jgi:hypothetical protein
MPGANSTAGTWPSHRGRRGVTAYADISLVATARGAEASIRQGDAQVTLRHDDGREEILSLEDVEREAEQLRARRPTL